MAYIDTGAYNKWRRQQEQQNAMDDYARQKEEIDNKYQEKPTGLAGLLSNLTRDIKSTGNTLFTTVSALASPFMQKYTDAANKAAQAKGNEELDKIAQKYGYKDRAEAMDRGDGPDDMWNEMQGISNKTSETVKNISDNFKNNAAVKKVNETKQSQYGADAIRTLRNAANVMGVGLTPVGGAIGGAAEGFADALEDSDGTLIDLQSDLSGGKVKSAVDTNLDWGQAARNAGVGALTGAVTAGVGNKLGNAKSAIGSKLLNNRVATSAIGRGAIGGAVGGAVGGGLGAGLEGGDVLGGALQGAGSGALTGGVAGGLTSGARKVGTAVTDRLGVTDRVANARQALMYDRGSNANRTAQIQEEPSNVLAEEAGVVRKLPNYDDQATGTIATRNAKKPNQQEPANVLSEKLPNYDGQATETIATRNAKNSKQQELSTSMAGQLRKRAAEKLLDQYGTVDKPIARSVNAIENVQRIADAGFEKPADVEKMIGYITGDGGKVTKLTRQLVATAKPVNTFDGLDSMIDDQIALHGLVDSEAKSVRSTLEAQFNRLPSRREGSISYTDNAEDVFDVVKALEKRSAELKGKSGNNYKNTTADRADKAAVLDAVAEVLKDRIYSGAAPMDKILTPEVRRDLINYAPKNKKWQNYVDNTIMKARDIGELRSSVAPFVGMGRWIENQYMNYGTYGQRVGDSARDVGKAAKALFKVPVAGQIAEVAANSNLAKRAMSKAYSKAADIADNRQRAIEPEVVAGRTPNTTTTPSTTTQISPDLQNVYNLLGLEIGMNEARSNASDNARNREFKNLEDQLTNTMADIDTRYQQDMSQLGGYGTAQSDTASQLLSQMNTISGAMNNALAAGDMTAYSQLASLYKDAYDIYKTQVDTTSKAAQKLSKTQQQANAASLALNELENMDPGYAYTVRDIPLLNLVNLNGNKYSSTADSLAMQIGYMLSGANIKEDEAKQIGSAYVPQPFDSEAVRNYKLQQARRIIQQYQNAYVNDENE